MVTSATGWSKPAKVVGLGYVAQYQSPRTQYEIRYAVKQFIEIVDAKPVELAAVEKAAELYFKPKRDYEQDVQKFFVGIGKYSPLFQNTRLSLVKTFLMENNIEFKELFWRRLKGRIKGSRALTQDEVPTNSNLRKILRHMPTLGQALFLTLSSSAMRIGETLKLKLADVDLEAEPLKFHVRGEYTKSGNPRTAFGSREAKEAIQEWLKVRDPWLQAASGKSHLHAKSAQDDRLFPTTRETAAAMYRRALTKAGFFKQDPRTNYSTLHIHVLRKFFRTRLGPLLPTDVVEILMGHEGYLTEAYRRYTDEQLADFYKKGEPGLLVYSETADMLKLQKDVEEQSRGVMRQLNVVLDENDKLKDQVKELRGSSRLGKYFSDWTEQDIQFLAERLKDLVPGQRDSGGMLFHRKGLPVDPSKPDVMLDFHD